MKITGVQVFKNPDPAPHGAGKALLGSARVTLDNAFILRGILIREAEDGAVCVDYPHDPFYAGEAPRTIAGPTATTRAGRTLGEAIYRAVTEAYSRIK